MARWAGCALLIAAALAVVGPAAPSNSRAVLGSITVSAGKTVVSSFGLVPGKTYHAVVTGTVKVEYPGFAPPPLEQYDAFYCYKTNAKPGLSYGGHCVGNKPGPWPAFSVQEGVGRPQCPDRPFACQIGLAYKGGICCKVLARESDHTYENDFRVNYAGKLKVRGDGACPATNSPKCVSGSFRVVISEAECKNPNSTRSVAEECENKVTFAFKHGGLVARTSSFLDMTTNGAGSGTFDPNDERDALDLDRIRVVRTVDYVDEKTQSKKEATLVFGAAHGIGTYACGERQCHVRAPLELVSSTDPDCVGAGRDANLLIREGKKGMPDRVQLTIDGCPRHSLDLIDRSAQGKKPVVNVVIDEK